MKTCFYFYLVVFNYLKKINYMTKNKILKIKNVFKNIKNFIGFK